MIESHYRSWCKGYYVKHSASERYHDGFQHPYSRTYWRTNGLLKTSWESKDKKGSEITAILRSETKFKIPFNKYTTRIK